MTSSRAVVDANRVRRIRVAIRSFFCLMGLILGNLTIAKNVVERSVYQTAAVAAVVFTICVWPGGVVDDD